MPSRPRPSHHARLRALRGPTTARLLGPGLAVVLTAGGLGLAAAAPAHAGANDIITIGQTQTFTKDDGFSSTTGVAGTVGAGTDNGNQGGYINISIPTVGGVTGGGGGNPPGSTATAPSGIDEGGQYRMMTNLWDLNTTWDCSQITGQRATDAKCNGANDHNASTNVLLSVDSTKVAPGAGKQYEYNSFTANSYFPTGRPGAATPCPDSGTFVDSRGVTRANSDLPCHWTPTQAHFPSSYPAMYKGCNFDQCSFTKGSSTSGGAAQVSAAFPTKLSSVLGLDSRWQVTLPVAGGGAKPVAPTDGVYDVAYDIWLDRGDNTALNKYPKIGSGSSGPENLPDNAWNLEQNNGAEVMLWVNNSGYAGPAGPTGDASKVITPAGKFVGTYHDTKGKDWDVWIGRQNKPNADGTGGPLGDHGCVYADNKIDPAAGAINDTTPNETGLGRTTATDQFCTQWNIVTYVLQDKDRTTDFQGDAAEYLFNSLNYSGTDPNLGQNLPNQPANITLDAGQVTNVAGYLNSICPQQAPATGTQIGSTALGQCISPNWWLTSIQTGMEVWSLPSNGGSATIGSKLGTRSFSVNPLVANNDPSGGANTGITGNAVASFTNASIPTVQHKAIVHFDDQWTMSYSGCATATAKDGTGKYTIHYGNGIADKTGALTQAVANSGLWEATVGPSDPGHDNTTVTVQLPCGDTVVGNAFVDPSGHVVARNGMPINGAQVTIGECSSTPAPNTPCPNAPLADITPQQVTETTPFVFDAGDHSGDGAFRWDVRQGRTYTVTASAAGCTTRTIGPLAVPPPRTGLLIVLDCARTAANLVEFGGGVRPPDNTQTGGGNLPTVVKIRPQYTNPAKGYCADVFVTNNTSAPVDWVTSFPVPLNQKIQQAWNIAYTQGGNPNVASNVKADAGSASWNTSLAPGATTHDVGFCTPFS